MEQNDGECYFLVPRWALDPIASKACKQLTKCNCSLQNGVSKCSGSCECRRSKQHCIGLCKCEYSCKWRENNNENNVELDNIMDKDDRHIIVEDQEESFHIDNEDVGEYMVEKIHTRFFVSFIKRNFLISSTTSSF